jgi:fumarate reductase flavoprotein subunit
MNFVQPRVSDLLVIGGGLAGERVAVEAALAGYAVTIVSQTPPRRSHSAAAQGGMQASLEPVSDLGKPMTHPKK